MAELEEYGLVAVIFLLAVGAMFALRGQARREPPKSPGLSGDLTIMSKVIRVGDAGTTATVAYQTKEGAPAAVFGVPTWSTTPDGVISLSPAGDGMSASVSAVAAGSATITVTAEGDTVAGVDTIFATGTIQVAPEEASGGTISFS